MIREYNEANRMAKAQPPTPLAKYKSTIIAPYE